MIQRSEILNVFKKMNKNSRQSSGDYTIVNDDFVKMLNDALRLYEISQKREENLNKILN